MKAGIIGFVSIILLVLVGIGIFTVTGRDSRESELEKSLSSAIDQTMNVTYVNANYEVKTEDEMSADFIGNFLSQFSSDAEVEVKIMNIDFINGCMDIEASETFKHLTGKEGKVKVRKTVIFDQFQDPNDKFFKVKFLNSNDSLFREIQVYNEGHLTTPTQKPAGFIKWIKVGDASWDGNFDKVVVTGDLTFKAVCS